MKRQFKSLVELIDHYGATKLARALNLSPSSVTLWKQGRTRPTSENAQAIVQYARGRITLATIYQEGGR